MGRFATANTAAVADLLPGWLTGAVRKRRVTATAIGELVVLPQRPGGVAERCRGRAAPRMPGLKARRRLPLTDKAQFEHGAHRYAAPPGQPCPNPCQPDCHPAWICQQRPAVTKPTTYGPSNGHVLPPRARCFDAPASPEACAPIYQLLLIQRQARRRGATCGELNDAPLPPVTWSLKSHRSGELRPQRHLSTRPANPSAPTCWNLMVYNKWGGVGEAAGWPSCRAQPGISRHSSNLVWGCH
jgi:hypothetical protein